MLIYIGARKSDAPKSKLENFLASASDSVDITKTDASKANASKSDAPVAKSDTLASKLDDKKPPGELKVAEAGKSILAAIDDKEGILLLISVISTTKFYQINFLISRRDNFIICKVG